MDITTVLDRSYNPGTGIWPWPLERGPFWNHAIWHHFSPQLISKAHHLPKPKKMSRKAKVGLSARSWAPVQVDFLSWSSCGSWGLRLSHLLQSAHQCSHGRKAQHFRLEELRSLGHIAVRCMPPEFHVDSLMFMTSPTSYWHIWGQLDVTSSLSMHRPFLNSWNRTHLAKASCFWESLCKGAQHFNDYMQRTWLVEDLLSFSLIWNVWTVHLNASAEDRTQFEGAEKELRCWFEVVELRFQTVWTEQVVQLDPKILLLTTS